jgi:hypothetical protein
MFKIARRKDFECFHHKKMKNVSGDKHAKLLKFDHYKLYWNITLYAIHMYDYYMSI